MLLIRCTTDLPAPHQHQSSVLIVATSLGKRWHRMVLSCMFLISDVLLTICISALEKMSKFLCPFLNQVFLLLSFSSPHILGINPL